MPTFTEALPLLPTRPSKVESGQTIHETDNVPANEVNRYSLWVSICFALNYSIGAGILGLPYEFYKTGYLLSSLIILFMGLVSYITNMYVVDAMVRAEAITTLHNQSNVLSKSQIISAADSVKQTLLHQQLSSQEIRSKYSIQRNEYQLSELIAIFCGAPCRIAYDISFGLSTLIGLWSYNVLFGVSLSRNFGIPFIAASCNMEQYHSSESSDCRVLYSVYVLIFWVWTLLITLIDFAHQQWLQITATIARIVIIALMVLTCIGLMYSVYTYDGNAYVMGTSQWSSSGSLAWEWSGIAYMIAVSAFAFGSQFCVMDVIQPLSTHNKQTKQHVLWASSVGICCVVYILCGVVISLYFASNTQSPCTLAWQGFMGFSAVNAAPIWAVMVSSIVVLLPAIDIGSAFPLIATTLANTLEAILLNVPKKDARGIATCYESCYNERYVVIIKITLCTLVSAIALLQWDFELILALSGAFKLLAVYVAPCYLQWKSHHFMKQICIDDDEDIADTFVTKRWITHSAWLFIITAICLVAFVAIFVYTLLEYV